MTEEEALVFYFAGDADRINSWINGQYTTFMAWAIARQREEAEAAQPAQWDGDVSQCAPVVIGVDYGRAPDLADAMAYAFTATAHAERKHPPLAYFTEAKPFNSFAGFDVVSSHTQEQHPAAKHWTQINDDTPAALSTVKAL